MAEKTYKIVKRTEYENRGGAPVYIDTSEVLRDSDKRKTVMKLKLFNNCGKTVKSVYFNAGCFDSDLNLCMQLKNVPYINVDAQPSTVFGNSQVVEIPNITRSVFVEVSRILFDDGSTWVNENQELDEDIVSEDALGEDWNRLRLTKKIKDDSDELKRQKRKSNRLSANKKLLIWTASLVGLCLVLFSFVLVQKYMKTRQTSYKTAMNYYINRDFENAAYALSEVDNDYMYFGNEQKEINYSAAISYMQIHDYPKALQYFQKCGNYKNSIINNRMIVRMYDRVISAGYNHSAVVKKDGTVLAFGDNSYGQCETGEWLGVIGVSAGGNHTIGMTYDGKLFASGNNEYGQCDISGWTDIIAVSTGETHTVALKANGRVIARGNNKYGQCNIQDWEDIVSIAAAGNHTIGLKEDGTVLAVGWNSDGQCDVSNINDVNYIATSEKNTALIKYDGSVVMLGDNSYRQCDTSGVQNVVSAALGSRYVVYVDVYGKTRSKGINDQNQGSVSLWNDIMSVSCGNAHTIGLSLGGGIYGVGNDSDGKLKFSNVVDIGAENIPISE